MSEGGAVALAPDEREHRISRFKEALQRAGVKLIHQRFEIFSKVARTDEHPDAGTVFRGVCERLPIASLDTVYRTLWLLIDLGVLTTLGPPRERVRFDANMRSRHHFVCTHCGLVRDFYSPAFDACKSRSP
jgi:Fur family peroxide stress response transcriptional regulator